MPIVQPFKQVFVDFALQQAERVEGPREPLSRRDSQPDSGGISGREPAIRTASAIGSQRNGFEKKLGVCAYARRAVMINSSKSLNYHVLRITLLIFSAVVLLIWRTL